MGASAIPPLRPASPPIPRPLSCRRRHPSRQRPPSCVPVSTSSSRSYGFRRNIGSFPAFAGAEGNGLSKEEAKTTEEKEGAAVGAGEASQPAAPGGGSEGDRESPRRPPAPMGIRWRELLLDPDPDNVLAVGLTGLLAWASVQVLWQVFFISLAILLAALKYSFVAALLLFILITLL